MLLGSTGLKGKPHMNDRGEDLGEALETIKLVAGELTKVTKVGTSLDPSIKEEIIKFMKENLNIFSWSHKDISGIP